MIVLQFWEISVGVNWISRRKIYNIIIIFLNSFRPNLNLWTVWNGMILRMVEISLQYWRNHGKPKFRVTILGSNNDWVMSKMRCKLSRFDMGWNKTKNNKIWDPSLPIKMWTLMADFKQQRIFSIVLRFRKFFWTDFTSISCELGLDFDEI